MIIPFLTVTLIGAVVALNRRPAAAPLPPLMGAGIAGAWVGFVLGGILGVFVDLLIIGGFWPFLLGHAGALALARVTASNRAALPG